MPIQQRGFVPNGGIIIDAAKETHQRIPTSSEDENLSSSRSRRLVSGYMFGNPPSPLGTRESSPSNNTTPPTDVGDSPPLSEPSPGLVDSAPQPDPVGMLQGLANMAISNIEGMAKRKSSKSRDRDNGYDALNGLNDGEADLDESAPQAAFSAEAYLKGDGGEASAYRFPNHRLRRTMKGESSLHIITFIAKCLIKMSRRSRSSLVGQVICGCQAR